jgi:hypothetical protein
MLYVFQTVIFCVCVNMLYFCSFHVSLTEDKGVHSEILHFTSCDLKLNVMYWKMYFTFGVRSQYLGLRIVVLAPKHICQD